MIEPLLAFSLFTLLRDFVNNFITLLQTFFDWIATTIIGWLQTAVGGVTLPTMINGNAGGRVAGYITDLSGYGAAVNVWLPLQEALGMFGTFWALWVALQLYRLIKSWIPFVSG